MKRFAIALTFALTTLSLTSQAAVWGEDQYALGFGGQFPDESSEKGLPEAIPCTLGESRHTRPQPMMQCVWFFFPRTLTEYDPKQQRQITYPNRIEGRCVNGQCLANGNFFGEWGENRLFTLSPWYYIAESTDGRPVAYRMDVGPLNGGGEVSYLEAAKILWTYHEQSGVYPHKSEAAFNQLYQGGTVQFRKDLAGGVTAVQKPKSVKAVVSAWCNPHMDDECYINEERVPVDDLVQYLPKVTREAVDQAGGYCEYPICYSTDDKPVGIL